MNENGFTLIEILIAVVITGIILGAVFMLLNQGMFTWQNTADQDEWEQNWRVLENYLQNDLHNQFYSQLYNKNFFQGDYQGLSYLIKKDGRIDKVSYQLDYYAHNIVRTEEAYQTTVINDGEAKSSSRVQREKIKKINFFTDFYIYRLDYQYFDPRDDHWVNDWSLEEKDYLPALLKLTISSKKENSVEKLPAIIIGIYLNRKYQSGAVIHE